MVERDRLSITQKARVHQGRSPAHPCAFYSYGFVQCANFLEATFLAGAFLAGTAFLAGAFLAGAFLAGAAFLAEAFLAGAFLAGAADAEALDKEGLEDMKTPKKVKIIKAIMILLILSIPYKKSNFKMILI